MANRPYIWVFPNCDDCKGRCPPKIPGLGFFLGEVAQEFATITPPKFNIAHEKWLEDYFPIGFR